MRFKIFQIMYEKEDKKNTFVNLKNIDTSIFFKYLNEMGVIYDENFKYAVMNVSKEQYIILGTLNQSYEIVINHFIGIKKEEKKAYEGEDNDKTYFFIDTRKGYLYIQNKRYSAENLRPGITFDRLSSILSMTLRRIYDSQCVLYPIKINYSVDDFWDFYNNSQVKFLEFKNIQGIELPLGTRLHNPREDLDEAMVESWNFYSKDKVDSFEIKSAEGQTINKNPFATLGLTLAKLGETTKADKDIIKKMVINDSEGEVQLKPKDNEHKVINISSKRQKDAYETYDTILKNLLKDYKGRF